jgi:archaemetzincin
MTFPRRGSPLSAAGPSVTRRQWLTWAALTASVGCQVPARGVAPMATSGVAQAPPPQPAVNPVGQVPASAAQPRAPARDVGASAPDSSASVTPLAAQPPEPMTIALQPLGEQIPDAQVALVEAALQAFYHCDVLVLPRSALPQQAYTAPRKRYRAELLLDALAKQKPAAARRILGITAVDISTTKGDVADWGILGLATIDGTACVISSFRTRRGARNKEHAMQRFAKTAVHEIGHTLGLEHCPNRGCLMEDGQGSVLTTDHEYELCAECRARLEGWGVVLAPPGTVPPWPRVN